MVAPFLGERFRDGEDASAVVAPPYDVISPEQRIIYARRSSHNIVHLTLPEGNGDRYAAAARTLAQWRAEGALVRDAQPSVYVLQQRFRVPGGDIHTRTGLIAAVAVEPYATGRVKPHERTHKGPKADRLALHRQTQSMFEALLMMARDTSGGLLAGFEGVTASAPDARGQLDGVDLAVWAVRGDEASKLTAAASADGALYIADGHHRYETAGTYRSENPAALTTLGLVVPLGDPGLVVLPTHRIIEGDAIDVAVVREAVDPRVDLKPSSWDEADECLEGLRQEGVCGAMIVAADGLLAATVPADVDLSDLPFASDPTVLALDVAKIDRLIVDKLQGETRGRRYSPESEVVRREVESESAGAGVLVNPTGVEQVLAVADAGAYMPQKSTYFAPKVPSGLAILSWELQP